MLIKLQFLPSPSRLKSVLITNYEFPNLFRHEEVSKVNLASGPERSLGSIHYVRQTHCQIENANTTGFTLVRLDGVPVDRVTLEEAFNRINWDDVRRSGPCLLVQIYAPCEANPQNYISTTSDWDIEANREVLIQTVLRSVPLERWNLVAVFVSVQNVKSRVFRDRLVVGVVDLSSDNRYTDVVLREQPLSLRIINPRPEKLPDFLMHSSRSLQMIITDGIVSDDLRSRMLQLLKRKRNGWLRDYPWTGHLIAGTHVVVHPANMQYELPAEYATTLCASASFIADFRREFDALATKPEMLPMRRPASL